MNWTSALIPVPRLQLVAFTRIRLAVDGKQIQLSVSAERMRVWDDNIGWTYIKGYYML